MLKSENDLLLAQQGELEEEMGRLGKLLQAKDSQVGSFLAVGLFWVGWFRGLAHGPRRVQQPEGAWEVLLQAWYGTRMAGLLWTRF